MGHLAHNANLSIKAILGLAAYGGPLPAARGIRPGAKKYADLAKADAANWMKSADDGDHYRLAFDKPGTWSQKYNLVWDQLLGLNIFPPSVAAKELAYYKTRMQPYGLPLDSRTKITKTDWTFWTATLAPDQAGFEDLVSPIAKYLNATTARLPLADEYTTDNLKHAGFHARPVVGGLFIKMLSDPAIWKKWASRADQPVGPWAPLHPLPVLTAVISPKKWHYITTTPDGDWNAAAFDDAAWKEGPANSWKPKAAKDGSANKAADDAEKVSDVWLRTKVPAARSSDAGFAVDRARKLPRGALHQRRLRRDHFRPWRPGAAGHFAGSAFGIEAGRGSGDRRAHQQPQAPHGHNRDGHGRSTRKTMKTPLFFFTGTMLCTRRKSARCGEPLRSRAISRRRRAW